MPGQCTKCGGGEDGVLYICAECLMKAESSIHSTALLDATERARLKQLEANCRWLIEITDCIHDALCPGEISTWQERAKQAVKAAKLLAFNDKHHTSSVAK